MNLKKLFAFAASASILFGGSIRSVAADGYWQEGYWDDANQRWVDGMWIETGASNNGWVGQPYQEYANGGTINYHLS